MRLNSSVNLAPHCDLSFLRLRVDAAAFVCPFYAGLPQKINTFRIRRAFVQSVFPPRQVNYYAYSTSVLGYPTLREAECLCYTAASPRVSSSRTAIARSYKAFAS